MPKENIIFSDGSSRGNPGPGGYGAIIVFAKGKNDNNFQNSMANFQVKEIGGREEKTTNNRMEMKALINALEFALSTTDYLLPTTIYLDSAYVVNGASKWAKGWQENGWKTKSGEDVLNKDLWEKIISLVEKFKITWKQIEGHAGIPGNERCDAIATSFADKQAVSLYEGPLGSYGVDISKIEPVGVSGKSKSAKAYSYISKVDGQILVHKTWPECEKRVKGKTGARFKKSFSKEDEVKIVGEFSK